MLCPPEPDSEERHRENSLVHPQHQSHSTEPTGEDEKNRDNQLKQNNAHFIQITNSFTQVNSTHAVSI